MKKTISIVIAGQVFYIEEDAYMTLENYLNSIKSYFSKMEGSEEIIDDIETRIAEKFLHFKSQSNSEAINIENVQSVISSMGTVADFQEFELNEEKGGPRLEEPGQDSNQHKKVFRRDLTNKKIGGVASGIAHYFEMDVTIIRIILLLGFLGLLPLMSIGNFLFWSYIVCWMAVPAVELESQSKEKFRKFFRDRENKVVGGVMAGIAAYTGWDIALLRVAALLSILFFGIGAGIYLVILMVTPYAETTTDKMQMRGEPITLENIENNLKKNVESLGGDGTISKFSDTIFKIARAVGDVVIAILNFVRFFIQYVVGFSFTIVGTILIICTIYLAISGFSNWENIDSFIHLGDDFSTKLFLDEFPKQFNWALLAILLPISTGIFIGGLSLLFNRKFYNKYFSIASTVIFFFGISSLIFVGSQYASNFKEEASVNEFNEYVLPKTMVEFSTDPEKEVVFKGNISKEDYVFHLFDEEDWVYNENDIFGANIYLEAYDGDKIQVLEFVKASGKTGKIAQRNAEMIRYDVNIQDNKFHFPRDFSIGQNKFRAQKVRIKILIPKNMHFKMNKEFGYKIDNLIYGLKNMDMKQAIWTVDENGGIDCVNFPDANKARESSEEYDYHNDMDFSEEMEKD